MELPYNINDKESIIAFAKKLKGSTLRKSCDVSICQHNYSGKGNFGQLLEKYYFHYDPNSESEPDFKEARLELKSSPLKRLKNSEYRSKERLVLNIINYIEIIDQHFESSSFWRKNESLLLIFYLHSANDNILDYLIKIVDGWNFSKIDLEIIRRDWHIIQNKVLQGKAHELSEGDTLYLGACTKGSKGGNPKTQPNNALPAKQRAYSLKQGYVNHIIATIANETEGIYGKIIKNSQSVETASLEEIVLSRFKPYVDKSITTISTELKKNLNIKAKNYFANLTNAILDIELGKKIEEFEKADIIVKTVRLQENDLPKESISFPTFRFTELVKEDWENSDFIQLLERKFLFVFYQFSGTELILRKVKFWNMPYKDIEKAKEVWNKTKEILNKGNIVRQVKNGVRYTNFPNKEFSKIAHVRPHARNANDAYPLPVKDQITEAYEFTKQCFWLNNNYVRDEIYLK